MAVLKPNGGPAFPFAETHTDMRMIPPKTYTEYYGGLSMRDYFAATALQGLLAAHAWHDPNEVTLKAYAHADAMLATRDRE